MSQWRAKEPKADRLTLNDSFDMQCEVWPASDFGNQVAGVLRYDPEKGARVDLIGSLHRDFPAFGKDIDEPLLGVTLDGQIFTLVNPMNVYSGVRSGRFAVTKETYRGLSLIFGVHSSAKSDFTFNRSYGSMTHLDHWLGHESLQADTESLRPLVRRFSYEQRAYPVIRMPSLGATLTFGLDYHETGQAPFSREMHCRADVVIGASRRRPTEWFDRHLTSFRTLLSLMCGEPSYPVAMVHSRGRIRSGEYVHAPVFFSHAPFRTDEKLHPLIPHAVIADDLSDIVNRWFGPDWQRLDIVHTLYRVALTTPHQSRRVEFLLLMQALEAFYTRLHGDNKKLQQVLEIHLASLPVTLRQWVCKRPKAFAKLLTESRNYMTHHNPKKQALSAQEGMPLYHLTAAARLFLEILLLRHYGVADEVLDGCLGHVVQQRPKRVKAARLA